MKLNIFFSWQTQTNDQGFNNKEFLIECINSVCNEIQDKGTLKNIFFDFHEGLRGMPGTPSVSDKMMEQIDDCDIFIGDMTITQSNNWLLKLCKKLHVLKGLRREPNSNVYGEFHRALGKSPEFEEQIILVMNDVNGKPTENANLMPFDSRERRFPIVFHLKHDKDKEKAKKKFVSILKDALQKSALAALKNIRQEISPFIGWQEQSKNPKLSGNFIWTDKLGNYKSQIMYTKGVVRLLGLSGLGKTKFIFECFRDSESKSQYLYCDSQKAESTKIKEKLSYFFKDCKEAILILDNCNKTLLSETIDLKSEIQNATNTIIAIYNEPKERQMQDIKYVIFDHHEEEIVEQLVAQRIGTFGEPIKKRIEEFASGIPMMAILLINSLKNGHDLGDLGDQALMTKLLGMDENDNQRVMMQTLALFKFVGWRAERRSELECVAKSKSITSINVNEEEVLMNAFDGLIQKCLNRGIMEECGRTVGIRPTPLALYLITEWIEKCSPERLVKVIDVIQKSKDAEELSHAFHQQFKYMGFCDKACEMLNQLLGENSPFGNVEVLNTELGSRLFRTFVEVNPIVVAEFLCRVLSPLSIDSLKGIDAGRRNLVWAVEKLCFDPRTFNKGAFLMMRLGIAENEEWSNNATSEFCSLFPVYLPETSANLDLRLDFLKTHILLESNKDIVLSAIERALSTRNFFRFSGAEKQGAKELQCYQPTNIDEIKTYLKGCSDLVYHEIKTDSSWRREAIKIFEHTVGVLCDFGMASLILPYILKTAELLGYDWDEMQRILSLFKGRLFPRLNETCQSMYEDIIGKLTKSDVVSRFARIEQESFNAPLNVPFEEKLKKQEAEFRKIAEEIVREHLYSPDLLKHLMLAKTNLTIPFGMTLAEEMSIDQAVDFIIDGIKILNEEPNAISGFFIDFVAAIKKDIFESALDVLKTLDDKRILFGIMGKRSILPQDESFGYLLNLVQSGEVNTDAFVVYWQHLQFAAMNENNIVRIFREIEACPQGLLCIFRMASMFTFGRELALYPKLTKYLQMLMMRFRFVSATMINNDDYIRVAKQMLFDGKEVAFAVDIHQEILKYLSKTDVIENFDYELRELYDILIDKYYIAIWKDLSTALVNEENGSVLYYRLKDLLGVSVMNENPVLFAKNHSTDFMNLCDSYPNIAPQRFVELMPIPQNAKQFPALLLEILEKYGGHDEVLMALGNNIGTFAVSGSAIPMFENQISLLSTLKNHSISKVSGWVEKEIGYLKKNIAHDSMIENELWAKYK